MDYNSELTRLKSNQDNVTSEYWKPEPGQYKVKSLSEIEVAEPYIETGKEPQERRQLKLLINNAKVIWSMPYGQTPASTYGQLIHLGSARGSLLNQEFTIVVTGTGKNKRFTLVI